MLIHTTKKLADWLDIKKLPEPPPEYDLFLSWRANYIDEDSEEFIVFMHEATRYAVMINKPSETYTGNLTEMFFGVLRGAMLADNINHAVIDRYIDECGKTEYVRNIGKRETAWLNKAMSNVWFGMRNFKESEAVSIAASSLSVDPIENYNYRNRKSPDEQFYEMLEKYGLPMRKGKAFDITVRLALDGNDAVRKLRVSANNTFEQLHRILQNAFGWQDSHLHKFGLFREWSENYYASSEIELVTDIESKEANECVRSVFDVKLTDYLTEYRRILYTYDFGDDWQHYIEVDAVIDDNTEILPLLLSGEGDAPPEDVGGSSGFAEFLTMIADPNHEDYGDNMEWAKEQFWERFDFEKVWRSVRTSLIW